MSEALRLALKELIVEACDKAVEPHTIPDDAPLFGANSCLQLDSLDALQISMAVQKRYGLRLADSKETRRVLASVASLAERLEAQ